MALSQSDALAKLKRMVAATQDPTIDDDDLTEILLRFRRAVVWSASTAFAVNDRVFSTAENGRYYICVTAGTTDDTEPDWPVQFIPLRRQIQPITRIVTVSDGTVIWQDDGPANATPWDLGGAARSAWLEKAGMVAHLFDFKDDIKQVSLEQRHKHCLDMAARYAPKYIV